MAMTVSRDNQEGTVRDHGGDASMEACAVCFTPPDHPYYLAVCGHLYCKDCATGLLLSGINSNKLPVTCCAASCGSPVSLHDFQQLLTPAQMDSCHKAAFRSYLDKHLDVWGYCPSPDCPQVYKKVPDGTVPKGEGIPFFCDCCLSSHCIECSGRAHAGMSCMEYKSAVDGDAEFQAWRKQHTQPCPKCAVSIEKDHGCNHMTCSQCKAHFCWLCGALFANSTKTYDHLVAKHNGIFDANEW